SVLERNPSLTMSEQGNTKIEATGEGERKLDRRFRIFATMNPAEYSGRQAMSPAYKDRWTSYMYVDPPTEADYLAMGVNMVYGEQPKVEIRNTVYQAEATKPLERIREVPNMREFLAKLAKFEVKLEEMARNREIGKGRKEKYIFTRRGLIEFFEFLEQKTIYDRKTGETYDITQHPKEIIQRGLQYYFLDKIAGQEDLKKVTDLMGAIGISETNWTVAFTEQAEPEEEKGEEKEEEEKGEKGEKVRFTWLGGRTTETTGDTSIPESEFKLGDEVRVKEGREGDVRAEVTNAKKLKVIGFQHVSIARRDRLYPVIQIDDGVCVWDDRGKYFELKKKEEKGEKVRFTWLSGRTEETTGDTWSPESELKLGDEIRLKEGVEGAVIEEVTNAKKLKVIGFCHASETYPDRLYPVIQIDDGKC
ncbi:MAG: hypothetical protein FJ088_14585, partial [Deltaproteobacteria bacterium]|nr:hypothetical protein [Deltaproteobacteria bacterium]